MDMLRNVTVTQIDEAFVVNAYTGRTGQITARTGYGLSFSQGGQITYTQAGEQYTSRPGTAVLLPKGSSYTSHCDREGLFPVINFQCEGLRCAQITLLPLAEESTCLRLFAQLRQLFLDPDNRLAVFALFYQLLSLLSQSTTPRPLHLLNQHIRQHLSDPMLSNSLLAEKMGISEVYLRKLFQNYYHTTPKQYILQLRLAKAKQMLVDTRQTVTGIAQACGFSSLHHFCRCFHEKTGMSPTQYALKNRIGQI